MNMEVNVMRELVTANTACKTTHREMTGVRQNTPILNEDIMKCLDTYCNTHLYVSTNVFITQGKM